MPLTSTPDRTAKFTVQQERDATELRLSGDWLLESTLPSREELLAAFDAQQSDRWRLAAEDDLQWDGRCMTRLFLCLQHCANNNIDLDISGLPAGMQKLLEVASAVKPQAQPQEKPFGLNQLLREKIAVVRKGCIDTLEFTGAVVLALGNLARGRANMRWHDFFYFVEQCGPRALGIVSLISVLVGMILAYLGSVQLRKFGAELYVADLVAIGTMREMGALMTAVIMAGRTGAAYAAQLGAMQANEEIDAITTLGLSPMEYLVLPRLLALILMMPLLCICADVLGLFGGALIASGMDITYTAFFHEVRESLNFQHVGAGLFKSTIFGALIASAGCQAGLQSGRSSAAVGEATTRAVVTSIVLLVIADAGINILYDKLGI
jgi:phospholipid/cholesterol/gamma-HCH transport system permease protein